MELNKNQIQFCDRILSRTSVYEESTDAIVQDTYPDIARIVCAVGSAVIRDESPQNDRVLISGTVKTVVLYQPEGEDGLREMTVPLSFAHIEDAKGCAAESTCFVCCRVVGVEARAVNSRKITVTARLCFETSAYENRSLALTQDVDGEGVPLEIRYSVHEVCLPTTVAARDFAVLEDLETSYSEDARLLHTRCDLCLTDSRAMHGKAILKGEARLRCLLLENGGLRTAEHTVPFTQILDCEGLEEGQTVGVRFAIQNLDSELHEDGVLSIGVGGRALLCGTTPQTLRTVQDLYQTTRPLEVQTQPVHLIGMETKGTLHGEILETVSVGLRTARVIDASAVCHGITQENASLLRLTTAVQLLLQSEEGQVHSVSRALTLPVALPQPIEGGSVQNLVLTVAATPASADEVSLRISVGGDLYCRTDCAVSNVSQVEMGAPETDTRDAVTLVMRYLTDEEPLWELAKRYHTTVRAIRGANDLAADAEDARARMLLIPICEK